ncbi:hypothetical protein Dimus_029886 [Dionaea muscipula]
MKRAQIHSFVDKKWLKPAMLFCIFTLSLLVLLSLTFLHSKSSTPSRHFRSRSSSGRIRAPISDIDGLLSLPQLPRFAYLISGTRGEGRQVKRLLQAVYHPRNQYVLHLDLEAGDEERLELAKFVKSAAVVREFRNVMVIEKADLLTYRGPTVIAATLHAVAILLKRAAEWDWFVNLSAWDYPLVSQDDLLHIFSYLPRDLNFIEHSSDIGWKEIERARPIIIDPGLYHAKKSGVFWAKEKRSLPSSFKLFTGSERVVLTKSFLEFCIWGWDNLPRTLLMYYTNFLSSAEGYFQTVICNDKNYQNTTMNHDLRYVKWDNPRKQQPINLTMESFDGMVQSGAPFAHRFSMDDPVLDQIDREILSRQDGGFAPGGWCIGRAIPGKDPCTVYIDRNQDVDAIKPSVNSRRLERLMVQLLDPVQFRSKQCV